MPRTKELVPLAFCAALYSTFFRNMAWRLAASALLENLRLGNLAVKSVYAFAGLDFAVFSVACTATHRGFLGWACAVVMTPKSATSARTPMPGLLRIVYRPMTPAR